MGVRGPKKEIEKLIECYQYAHTETYIVPMKVLCTQRETDIVHEAVNGDLYAQCHFSLSSDDRMLYRHPALISMWDYICAIERESAETRSFHTVVDKLLIPFASFLRRLTEDDENVDSLHILHDVYVCMRCSNWINIKTFERTTPLPNHTCCVHTVLKRILQIVTEHDRRIREPCESEIVHEYKKKLPRELKSQFTFQFRSFVKSHFEIYPAKVSALIRELYSIASGYVE